MQWHNEPARWSAQDTTLAVTADPRTDFWRKTHYGFIRDNGHLFYQEVEGDFVCEVVVCGAYATLYDQAGLMVRADETTWLKCGIEYVEGVQYASAVVTRDFSDWSVAPLDGTPEALRLRITRQGGSIEIAYDPDGMGERLLRVAYLSESPRLLVGPMCAAPQGDGFEVRFEGFSLRPLDKEHSDAPSV
ncbi:MAG: DUF1349 domain-containing protein [Roseiflexaceae bacterium]